MVERGAKRGVKEGAERVAEQSILPLRIENAGVKKRGKDILSNISLTFGETGFTVMMGPNGAGKTTLLRLMHGLERPRSGTVSWNIEARAVRVRQAFVFQTPIIMRRSVINNIAYPLVVRGVDREQAGNKARHWADKVGLGSRGDLDAKFLSGGERQKLAIARALIGEPDLVFLDEPTTNLDGQSTREIETILRHAFDEGTRIIMTTHDIGQARRLATDVVFLNRGHICEHGPADAFFKQPSSDAAQSYLRGDIVE